MEKIASVQASVKTAGKVQTAQAIPVQGAEPKDDFMKLLSEKRASADQTKESADAKKEVAEQPAGSKTEEPKEPAEPKQPTDDGLEDALNQALAEAAAALMTATVTEDRTGAEVQTTATEMAVTEAVTTSTVDTPAVMEEVPEVPAEAEAPIVRQEPAADQPAKETVKPEVQADQTADPQAPVAEVRKDQAAPKEDTASSEDSREEAEPQAAQSSISEEPVKEVSKEEMSMNAYHVQSRSLTEQPGQMQQVQPKGEEASVKATVEELPQEITKAVSSGQLTDGKTLTIELEPASLGKLTIRLVYEAGKAAVSILAANPRTLDILNEKAPELAQILKERTGEETVIYTQETEQQQPEEQYDEHRGKGQERQDERQERREEEAVQADSFAQQLRLGLVV